MNDSEFAMFDPADLTLDEVCQRITRLTAGMMEFWKDAKGWAPLESADLLSASMLDEQGSLAASLERWVSAETSGDLILAWANLGALVEGQLKLLLSVYLLDYQRDVPTLLSKKGKRLYSSTPDGMMLHSLQKFCETQVWDSADPWDDYVNRVRTRRNTIHAFQYKDIGTFAEWRDELRNHLEFIEHVNELLPYPDDEYTPRAF